MKTLYASIESENEVVLKEGLLVEPAPHELLLEAQFSTMSPGTESALMAGKILPLPQNLGYSMAARVVAVGTSVDAYKVGDAVVATAMHANYQLVDQRLVTPVPDGVDLEQAAFFNLAHTALYGIRRGRLQLGEPVLIMGQGLVGALATQFALAAGAAPVIVTDVSSQRLQLAEQMGAHYCINPQTALGELEEVINELGLDGVPVIIDATGLRQPLELAVDLISERGRIVMLSTVHGGEQPNLTEALMMKGAALIGGYVNSKPFALRRTDLEITAQWPPRIRQDDNRYSQHDVWTSDEDIRAFLNLLKHDVVNISPLITHRFSFTEIPEAYSLVTNGDQSLVGGLIDWRASA